MSGEGKRRTDATGRTSGRAKLHGGGLGGQFIAHSREMRLSVSWRMLSGNDKLVLERIEEEHMAHGGRENGRLHVTYSDLEAAGVRRMSISTCIARLEALGFVECVDRGRAARAEFRFPASYRLTYVQGNLAPTDDWKAIVTVEEAERRIANAAGRLADRAKVLRRKLTDVRGSKAAGDGPSERKKPVAKSLPTPVAKTLPTHPRASSENATTVAVAESLLPYRSWVGDQR